MNTWAYAPFDTPYRISAATQAAAELLRPLMADMGARDDTGPAHWQVEGEVGRWHLLNTEDNTAESFQASGDLLYALFDQVVFRIADQHGDGHCLHAAAVSHEGRALLMPAASGQGKSTLCAWLVNKGFGYLSDELIVINQHAEVRGISRPIQVKPGSVAAVETLLAPGESLLPGELSNSATASALGGHCHRGHEPVLAGWLFPRYEKGAACSIETMSTTEVAMAALATHVNARNLPGHGFSDLVNLVRPTRGLRLVYGGFETLPTDLTEQVISLLSQP